ncbi:MAG: nitrite/sulfite reductase [Alphaproteobacteria bacterium]
MYRYDEFDRAFVDERVTQFAGQIERRLDGRLTEDEFRPLRLMNGVYLQLHAYMLRVAVPYGTLSSQQMRRLARISRDYDRGYGHFTTRQNIQFNWPRLEDMPAILADLAEVEMHAVQTSGNCIRNVTADHFAGAAADEIEDPRVYCEIVRQWSSLHPEFSFLPRKFKIAITGSARDRAAIRVHDIGIAMRRKGDGEAGFEIFVGGGLGRTPMLAKPIRAFLPRRELLSYLEAILRVYNQLGRRDNKYKARIKILVQKTDITKLTSMIEEEWQRIRTSALQLPEEEIARIRRFFSPPAYVTLPPRSIRHEDAVSRNSEYANRVATNTAAHKTPGYVIANISLKPIGGVPGDATDAHMDALADLADQFSFGEIRIAHEQNVVLAHVRLDDLFDLWRELEGYGLATPNFGLVSDIISCPGLDFCNLANARSIPVAQRIGERFSDLKRQHDIGALSINISGCINACGHHHVGNIGILGVDKKGVEAYQITLGGRADEDAAIGRIIGPAFSEAEIVDAVETVIETYIDHRTNRERFVDTFARIGEAPFKEKLYGAH